MALAVGWAAVLCADKPVAEQLKDVQDRFKTRAAEIAELKDKATVGESIEAHLLAIDEAKAKKDAKLTKLLKDENDDRDKLFELLAKKNRTAKKKVMMQFVVFRYGRAKPDHMFRGQDKKWTKKSAGLFLPKRKKSGAPQP